MREFKVLNREKESAEELAKSLRGELDLINSQKVVAVRQLKSYLKDNDFKHTEELSELRELVEQKQKIIDLLKTRHLDELKKHSTLTHQSYQDLDARCNELEELNGNLKS